MPPKKRMTYDMETRLKAIVYAKANSIRRAGREYSVDESCVRRWIRNEKKIREALHLKGKRSVRANEKKIGRRIDPDFEAELVGWMAFEREARHPISRKALVKKALSYGREDFKASLGWMEKFLRRNGYSLRRTTTQGQREPADLLPKLAAFVAYIEHVRRTQGILPADIITMDETAVWLDSAPTTTLHARGERTVSVRTTGHERACITVCLTATGDGTKLKPLIVFKGAIRDVQSLSDEFRGQAYILSTKSGWMDQEATIAYLNRIFGLGSTKKLLVWDAFRCHTTTQTKSAMKQKKIISAIIPSGCTGKIQVADVVLIRPFKQHIVDLYSEWIADDTQHNRTPSGNLRAPSRRQLVQWVIAAWGQISNDMVREAHKTCGLTTSLEGEEDEKITCLRRDEGRRFLGEARAAAVADEVETSSSSDDDDRIDEDDAEVVEVDRERPGPGNFA